MNEEYSSNTDLNVADLSDVTLEIQPDNLNDICNTWESSIKGADLESIDVKSAFKPLTNNGVGVSYIECLHNSFTAAQNLILSTSSTIKQVTEEQVGISNQYYQDYGGGYYSGSSSSGGSSGGSSGNSSGSTLGDSNQEYIPDTGVPIDQVDQDKIKINKEFVDKINSLDTNSYISFMTALSSISTNNLLGLLVDEKMASSLKKALLTSPNLSENLKKLISEMDENEIQVTLQSILTDEIKLSETSKNIIYKYTESLSKGTNLDILKVTKEAQFYQNVDELFTAVNTLANKTNLQEELLNIYDGTLENKNIVDFTRIVVDTIAEKNNINYEDLLSNKEKETIIKEELNNLSKSLSYFKTVNNLGTEAAELLYKTAMS